MRLIDADVLIEHLRKDPLFCMVERYGIEGVIENAPTIEPSGDLISRKTLIGAIEKCGEEKIYPQALIQTIKALPSAEQVTSKLKKPCDSLLTDDPDGDKESKSKLDLISRADVMKIFNTAFRGDIPYAIMGGLIQGLPSAEYSKPLQTTLNSDFVSREDAKREVYLLGENPSINEIWDCLDALPAADRPQVNSAEWVAEKEKEFEELNRPKGEWIVENHEVVCSICGQNNLETNYCPNCGADMRGEK